MLMPSIFGENLFDDLFDDFARPMNVIHYATPPENAGNANGTGLDVAVRLQ